MRTDLPAWATRLGFLPGWAGLPLFRRLSSNWTDRGGLVCSRARLPPLKLMADKKRPIHKLKKPPKPTIVELDPDGAGWLRTGKKARRLLTRDEFMRLVEKGGVLITRAK